MNNQPLFVLSLRPESAQANLEKPLLILDLDEALVYTVEVDKPQPPGLTPDYVVGSCKHQVYRRPFLTEFLTAVWRHYNVAVWSSGGKDYVEQTISLIMEGFPEPLFVWSVPRCTRRFNHDTHEEYYIKDLKKVRKKGYNPGRMLIVDDTPAKSERNYGCAVYIKEFNGETDDRELLYLAQYLESIADYPDFRTLEKRGWRKAYGDDERA